MELLPTSPAESVPAGDEAHQPTTFERLSYLCPTRHFHFYMLYERGINTLYWLPEGYDTIIGERGSTLSGGQQQRLAIARALVRNASIVILDEPTSALDAATESGLLKALQALTAGRTTFVIAHRLSTIRNVDRVVVLSRGQIIEVGSHRELLASDGLFAEFHKTQFWRDEKATAL